MSHHPRTRVEQTRQAILRAFNDLVLQAGVEEIRVSDVIRQADVGRSTFYEHFPNVENLFQQAIGPPLELLAKATLTTRDKDSIVKLLNHFAENRRRAQAMMADARVRDQMVLLLAERYAAIGKDAVTDPELSRLKSRQLAESTLAIIRVWINREIDCPVELLAKLLLDCTEKIHSAFEQNQLD